MHCYRQLPQPWLCPLGSNPSQHLSQTSPPVRNQPALKLRPSAGDTGQIKVSPQQASALRALWLGSAASRAGLNLEKCFVRKISARNVHLAEQGIFLDSDQKNSLTNRTYLPAAAQLELEDKFHKTPLQSLSLKKPARFPNTRVIKPASTKPDLLMQYF